MVHRGLCFLLAVVSAGFGGFVAQAETLGISLRPVARSEAVMHAEPELVARNFGIESVAFVTTQPDLSPDNALIEPGALAVSPRPPRARDGNIPRTRWEHRRNHKLWNRAALSALKTHGTPLTDIVPADIETWCPRYESQDADGRRAFWLGFMSALAFHESTYREDAVGGPDLWYGLLQILPATARGYKCHVGTGEALKNGAANLSCAVRIMAVTVPRDGVVHGKDRKFRGVSADWGPMTKPHKRADIARWTRRQTYCQELNAVRPKEAPRAVWAARQQAQETERALAARERAKEIATPDDTLALVSPDGTDDEIASRNATISNF